MSESAHADRLHGKDPTLAHDERGGGETDASDVSIPEGPFTVIVGPNACGKCTLLKALSRTIKPRVKRPGWTQRRSPPTRRRKWRGSLDSFRSPPPRPGVPRGRGVGEGSSRLPVTALTRRSDDGLSAVSTSRRFSPIPFCSWAFLIMHSSARSAT